jgi:hypothetical protein
VHGGPEKAVHLYPSNHYAKLAAKFADAAPLLVPGSRAGIGVCCSRAWLIQMTPCSCIKRPTMRQLCTKR